jgi:hypothetical protein
MEITITYFDSIVNRFEVPRSEVATLIGGLPLHMVEKIEMIAV